MEYTDFLMSCFYGCHFDALNSLKKNPALINKTDLGGFSGLLYAALNNQTAMVKLLISKGADPFLVSSNDDCAMSYPIVVYEVMFSPINYHYTNFVESEKHHFDLSCDPVIIMLQKSNAKTKCPDLYFILMNPWETVLALNTYMNYYLNPTEYPLKDKTELPLCIQNNKTLVYLLFNRFEHLFQVWDISYKSTIEKIDSLRKKYVPTEHPFLFGNRFMNLFNKHYQVTFSISKQ